MEFNLLLVDQIGQHLKSLRKLRGLSQAQLGQRLGVGQARVAAIEANPGTISVEQLLRIFQVLGVDLVARVKPASAPTPAKAGPNPKPSTQTNAVVTQARQRQPAAKTIHSPHPVAATQRNHPQQSPVKQIRHAAPEAQTKQKPPPKKAKASPATPRGSSVTPVLIKKNKGQW